MRFTQFSTVSLLFSAASVSAQNTYGKGKAGITKQGVKDQYIPGRYIVEFAKTGDFQAAGDASSLSPYLMSGEHSGIYN